MISQIKNIIEKNDTKKGRVFDLCIQFLIVVSLISFSVETLPNLRQETRDILRYLEVFTVSIFTAEYLLRLFVADKKRNFILSFFGIIDLVSILPFYISTGIDLRSIRIFRVLRLLRTFKLLRYGKAVKRFHCALRIAKEELVLFFFITLLVLYVAAVGIYYFENSVQPDAFSSVFTSLWWALATLTTVGYGDVYPITVGGRVFTFFILMIGLGIVAVPTGLLASALSKAREIEADENKGEDNG